MTKTLKDMMTARADAAPGPHIDIEGVIVRGRRRVWRNRAVSGSAACAAVVAAAMVVPTLVPGGGERPGVAGSGTFEVRKVTYAEGSTIHYGSREIDVSPHEVTALAQTDDGFVFADADDTVYFTDGDDTEAIGRAEGRTTLGVDDSGSYAAWIENDGGSSEVVVYDTSTGEEALREAGGVGPCDGWAGEYDRPQVQDIDGANVYVCSADGVVAIDVSTGATTPVVPAESSGRTFFDAADGRVALSVFTGAPDDGMLLRSAGGNERRYPTYFDPALSPGATAAVVNEGTQTHQGKKWSFPASVPRVLDLPSGRDVSPEWGDYEYVRLSHWIDDDTFVAYAARTQMVRSGDLLRCSVASGSCQAVASVGSLQEIRLPWGYDSEES